MGRWAKKSVTEWEGIFKAQAESGVSGTSFCREQGLHYKQFLYFRKKIGGRSHPRSLAVAASDMVAPAVRRQGFVPIRIESGCTMRLRFPRGLVVESDRILPASWVAEAAERWLRMGE